MTTSDDNHATADRQHAASPDRRYAPSTRAADLADLAAGNQTGWWDDHGRPAPWPEDFFLADGTINPDWRPAPGEPAKPGQPPF